MQSTLIFLYLCQTRMACFNSPRMLLPQQSRGPEHCKGAWERGGHLSGLRSTAVWAVLVSPSSPFHGRRTRDCERPASLSSEAGPELALTRVTAVRATGLRFPVHTLPAWLHSFIHSLTHSLILSTNIDKCPLRTVPAFRMSQ